MGSGTPPPQRGQDGPCPSAITVDAATLAILQAAFDEAWEVLTTSGGSFDQEATRTALADLIMSFAAEGETNPKRLKELALAALPRTLEAS